MLVLQPPNVTDGNLRSGFQDTKIRQLLFSQPNQVKPSLSSPFSFFSSLPPPTALFTFLMVLYF